MKERITIFDKPDGEYFLSQYGYVTYRQWCKEEIWKAKKRGRKYEIVSGKDGQIALAWI